MDLAIERKQIITEPPFVRPLVSSFKAHTHLNGRYQVIYALSIPSTLLYRLNCEKKQTRRYLESRTSFKYAFTSKTYKTQLVLLPLLVQALPWQYPRLLMTLHERFLA